MSAYARFVAALGRPLVMAHRGASAAEPENSLAALKKAAELGADGVEFDVQRCGSGELVVFHDRSLARCTGAVGGLDETPLSRLRTLTLDREAARLGSGTRGERIPTLDEWLAEVPRGLFVNLEAKCDRWATSELGHDCARALQRHGLAERAVVSSFHPAALAAAAGAQPQVERAMLVGPDPGWRFRLAAGALTRPVAMHVHHSLVTEARVRAWHRLGWVVAVWTVDERDEIARCVGCGVDVLITNRPDVARSVVG